MFVGLAEGCPCSGAPPCREGDHDAVIVQMIHDLAPHGDVANERVFIMGKCDRYHVVIYFWQCGKKTPSPEFSNLDEI